MEINVLRLRTVLDDRENELIRENTNFLEEINNELIEDDLLLKEGVKDAAMTIVFVETGGCEASFVKIFPEIKDNLILLLSNGKNNSLPASFEIKTYCAMNETPAIIMTGNEKTCADYIRHFSRVYHAKKQLKNNNLAVIGEPSDWLIASKVDPSIIKEKFDINIINISMDELIEEIDKKEMVRIPHQDALRKKYKNAEILDGAFYIYSALKRLVKKYDLQGLTIRCFDLLGKYKNTACLALALLNEEGITSACEGDLPALLTMHMLYALTGRPSFQANPSKIDQNNKTVLFAHCTLPLNMVSKYELLTHFESNLGIGIKGEMPLGEVTICKLFIDNKKTLKNSVAISGTIRENLSLPGYCRTQINVELSDYDFVTLFKENFGNHLIITYASAVDDFYTLVSFYDMKNIMKLADEAEELED